MFAKINDKLLEKIRSNQVGGYYKVRGVLSQDSLRILIQSLVLNTTIETLDLDSAGVLDKGCAYIKDLLESESRIKKLDLQMNGITSKGCKHLLAGLQNNTYLREMYLGENYISENDVKRLIAVRPKGTLQIRIGKQISGSFDAPSPLLPALDSPPPFPPCQRPQSSDSPQIQTGSTKDGKGSSPTIDRGPLGKRQRPSVEVRGKVGSSPPRTQALPQKHSAAHVADADAAGDENLSSNDEALQVSLSIPPFLSPLSSPPPPSNPFLSPAPFSISLSPSRPCTLLLTPLHPVLYFPSLPPDDTEVCGDFF